jgi:signal transduction histidine kinase
MAVIQHELRTPLSVVQGHAQLLHRRLARIPGLPDGELTQLQHSATAIERACRDLAAIINRLEPLGPDDAPRRDSDQLL